MLDLPALARAETRRQVLGLSEVAPEHVAIAGGVMVRSEPGSWANLAVGLGLEGPVSDADLDALVAFYDERSIEPRIEVLPFAHESLVAGLGRRGFVVDRFENMLVRPLDAGLPSPEHGWPAGVEVRPVAPGDEDAFVQTSTSGFRAPGEHPPPDDAIARRMLAHPLVDSLIAWAGTEPIGAGSAETRGEAAGLFGTSVVPAWRRRGVQQALIVARLRRAQDRGARVACIESRPGIPTERNAMRLGFVVACTKVLLVRPRSDILHGL